MSDIRIDTSNLTYTKFFIPELGADFIEGANTPTISLEPGLYGVQQQTSLGANFRFEVTPDGFVNYDIANDGFLSGRGTTTLILRGFTITLDARSLSHDLLPTIIGALVLPRDSTHELTLVPAVGYIFQPTPGFFADFQFALDVDGQIVIEPRYGGFTTVNGQTLTISGYQITIDGRLLSHDLGLFLLGNRDREILPRDSTHELTLIPAAGYIFQPTPGFFADFQFALDVDGQIVIEPRYGGFTTVNGQTLTISGYQITIDGRLLSHDLGLFLLGNRDREILPRDSTHELTLIPAAGYIFQPTPGFFADFQFALDVDGQIVVEPRYGGFTTVNGRTLTISGYQITMDGRLLSHDLGLFLLGNEDMLSRDSTHELTLIPAVGYIFRLTPGVFADFQFALDVNGQIVVSPQDEDLAGISGRTLTIQSDAMPRRFCGTPDPGGGGIRIAAYGSPGGRWSRGNLTYSVNLMGYSGLTQNVVNGVIAAAFQQWQAIVRFFNFNFLPGGGNADIRIQFGGANLDDRFGKAGGVAGSGGYPGSRNQGNLYFDSSEAWTPAFLLSVALHEIGHVLGLAHSTNRVSLMYPYGPLLNALDAETIQAIRALYGWQPQISLNDRASLEGPSLAVSEILSLVGGSDQQLYMAWRGIDNDDAIYWSSLDGDIWSPQKPIPGFGSLHGPTLTTGFSRTRPDGVPVSGLFMAWDGVPGDDAIYFAQNLDPAFSDWTNQQRIDGVGTSDRPALALFYQLINRDDRELKPRMHMAWKGIPGDNSIYWSSFDGNNWSPQVQIRGRGTSHGPALAVLGNKLYMFWKGIEDDSNVYYAWIDDQPGAIWQAQRVVAYTDARTEGNVEINIGTSSRPVATVRGNTIFLAWKGIPGDSGLYFASLENNEWSGQINIAGVGSASGPGLATFNGRLYMAWRGIPGDDGLYFSWLG
jgi:Matrixin